MKKLLENWHTSLLGFIGGTTITSVLAAFADPDFMAILQNNGISPTVLIIVGGIAKIWRDVLVKDSTSKS